MVVIKSDLSLDLDFTQNKNEKAETQNLDESEKNQIKVYLNQLADVPISESNKIEFSEIQYIRA